MMEKVSDREDGLSLLLSAHAIGLSRCSPDGLWPSHDTLVLDTFEFSLLYTVGIVGIVGIAIALRCR